MRALTLSELILLNLLRQREAERNLVAKLHGLTRFAKGIAPAPVLLDRAQRTI